MSIAVFAVADNATGLDGRPARAVDGAFNDAVQNSARRPGRAKASKQQTMEGTLLQPLPPFRAKPSRKPLVPKLPPESRKADADEISVKARRVPVRLARLKVAPSLRILGLPDKHA